mmetsp:Transcript_25818/g.63246  ORF Transcript_25818/g.63246 Transcript_25818/m.63246 type:complete len:102 (+) Transcript_25818:594-899(+)
MTSRTSTSRCSQSTLFADWGAAARVSPLRSPRQAEKVDWVRCKRKAPATTTSMKNVRFDPRSYPQRECTNSKPNKISLTTHEELTDAHSRFQDCAESRCRP